MKKKYAVLGVNGYIGRHLYMALEESGADVTGFGRTTPPPSYIRNYSAFDVTAPYDGTLDDFDVIFYLVGKTGTVNSFREFRDFIEINEIALCNLLEGLGSRKRQPMFIYVSTRLVYEGSEAPLPENAAKNPRTVYATSKLAGENILQAYAGYYEMPAAVLRVCVPYGNKLPGEYSYGTTGFMMKKAKAGESVNLYGDGALRRTFTHVEDIARQLIAIANTNTTGFSIYNAPGEDFSLKEVAAAITEKFGTGVTFSEWPEADAKVESGSTVFDAAHLVSMFNIKPGYKFKEWLNTLA